MQEKRKQYVIALIKIFFVTFANYKFDSSVLYEKAFSFEFYFAEFRKSKMVYVLDHLVSVITQ